MEENFFRTGVVTKTWDDFQVVDPKAFRSQSVFAGDLYYVGGSFIVLIFLAIVMAIYRSYKRRRIGSHIQNYQKRKSQSKLIALKMSQDASNAMSAIAKATNLTTDGFLADNRSFERSVNQLRAGNPNDPLLGLVQSIREQADFLVSNPKVAFVSSQMLEVSMEVRVFVSFQGKEHSFLSRVLRVTDSELWVQPPKAKGKVINLNRFKEVEIRLYRPQDGEYSFVCSMQRQIRIPVNAIILAHTLSVQRMTQRKQERIAVEIDRKVGYLIPKMDSQFSFGETELISNTVRIVDISSGGLRVATEDMIEGVDIDVEVVTTLPEVGIRRKIMCKIVRMDRPEGSKIIYLHLMFTSLNERNRHLLEKFVHLVKVGGYPTKKARIPNRIKEAIVPNKTTIGLIDAVQRAEQEVEGRPLNSSEDTKQQQPEPKTKILAPEENDESP